MTLIQQIKDLIRREPLNLDAHDALYRVLVNDASLASTLADRLWLVESCKQAVQRIVTNPVYYHNDPKKASALANRFLDLQKDALLLAAPDDFDSYIQYIEWEREPRKRFYLPRRSVLKTVVDAMQDLADDKLDLLAISLPPGVGKLLADDTPVWTKEGWKNHGDLKIGDFVVGLDGQYKRVEYVSPKDYADYEVTFTNGEVVRCHGNHEWLVYNKHRNREMIMQTKDMLNDYQSGDERVRGHRYFYLLPFCEPVVGEEKNLPVDPYVLGAWLGDGTNDRPALTICNTDLLIVIEMLRKKYQITHVYEQVGCRRYEFAGLREDLHKLGLCYAHRYVEKYIPEEYLNASLSQRLSLLAGLIDTDGTKQREGCLSFSTINEKLKDGMCDLISTFGWRYSLSVSTPKLSSSGVRGKKQVYNIKFCPTYKIPCKVWRKRLHVQAVRRKISISSIRKINPVPGNCIQVEGEIYRVGRTMLPTHNSTLAIFFMTWLAGKHPDKSILGASHSNAFIRGVYDECLRILDPQGEYLWHDVFPHVQLVGTNAKDSRIDLDTRKRFETLEFTSIGTGNAGLYRAMQLLYCDDLVSGIEVALSKERLDKLWETYTTDLRQRKMLGCKELHIATRWSVHDVIGRLERQYEGNPRYRFIAIPALNDEDESNFDYINNVGFSTENYHQQRQIMDEVSWKALYMNQPIEREGLLYHADELQRYFDLPDTPPDAIISVCDTKDRGQDYCVMPIAYQYGQNFYIEEILCDNSNPEIVDARLVDILLRHKVQMSRFESNSAGGRVAKDVQEQVKKKGGITKITTKFTTANKETKIIMASPYVKEHFFFKDESKYTREYRKAMNMICSYTMSGKNKHDDTVDALAQLVEYIQSFQTGKVEVRQRMF